MKSIQDDYERVTVIFSDCKAGWMHMRVEIGKDSVNISLSDFCDPIPALICWLEAILTGVSECSFIIDEEGTEKKVIAIRSWDERVLLKISEACNVDELFVSGICHSKQLVEAFYGGLKEFSKSPEYKPEEWEREPLGARLTSILSIDETDLLAELVKTDREELEELFFKAAPRYIREWPQIKDPQEHWEKAVDRMFHPENKEHEIGMQLVPIRHEIDDDFDTWDDAWKRKYLRKVLDQNVSNNDGIRIGEIHSQSIEGYLHNSSGAYD